MHLPFFLGCVVWLWRKEDSFEWIPPDSWKTFCLLFHVGSILLSDLMNDGLSALERVTRQ